MNITIIGTGYVGLVTGACFSKMGNKVYCVDTDSEKIEGLKNNVIPIFEPQLNEIVKTSHDRGDLVFTTNIRDALDNTDIIFIAVGTPMKDDGSANLDYIFEAARNIGNSLSHDSLIVIKSTVPVGTAFEVKKEIEDILSENNSNVKIDIASNPEFLKEGSAVNDCLRPDRIVLGAEKDEVFETLKDLYSSFVFNHDRFILMDIKSSEMTKYVANAMLATKISFMNEIANICEVTGANIKNVRLGIGSDKRIGYDFIYAGCGYGGSCFPKDVQALINTAQQNGYDPKILSNVEEVNNHQKKVLVNKVVSRFGDDLSGLTFAIWGLSFKPYTNDVREATSLTVISSLIDKGAKIKAYDSKAIEEFKKFIDDKYLDSIEFADSRYSALDGCEALILITEWKEFRNPDFNLLADKLNKKIIFDGRNIYNPKIRNIGFELYQIGC
ncbi:MAG: UDP-glucose/GDP-mannose dehydrogenase family protein [Methanobrevibacter thaueri]|uniref:UDP-glucose 6-dehydrogenase n=1 Tax=Methanobrevibacter thaueri TaxID=190975 RepID=A0A8T3VEL8_9EURY|nr:UDP-glucose/GDP-mannose dehydrogenase family protein [Methanobrevibacter thaueri]MBE6501048.1 UDP-glucose/GDP-mannose dehydrogenase family protein [Methanobrevibacter thaueri]